ncbi:type III-B CRISPR module RAMP protein Cmr4 [Fervidobacterium islandicum]|uniref:type III-B CRISPR module RAMP protein Cmr4 n=1 Tax=Fervidobacterium islandicum TaxID=2423 RepID=UPI003A67B3EA
MERQALSSTFDKIVVTMYAESQLHVGKGMDIGIVDLPIQRERTTGFPIIQGIKGSLRANINFGGKEKEIFGSEPSESSSNDSNKGTTPGQIAFSEAKILLFPVREHERLFVWVTCPLALIRFFKELGKHDIVEKLEKLNITDADVFTHNKENKTEIMLEDFKFTLKEDKEFGRIGEIISKNISTVDYIKEKIKKDILIVNDKTFAAIVETMTEIIPRIRINKTTGTVDQGALWYEEYLPQDTIMYFVARRTLFSNTKNEENQKDLMEVLKSKIDGTVINVGGKETVGKGLVSLKVVSLQ